jgi:hypothetical protein
MKRPMFYGQLQRHIDTAMATAGDVPQRITAFLDRIERMFNDVVFNFTLQLGYYSPDEQEQIKYLMTQVMSPQLSNALFD